MFFSNQSCCTHHTGLRRSVNSFGTASSDLDMSVAFDTDHGPGGSDDCDPSRLVFHAKGGSGSDGLRGQVRRYCDQLANLLQFFLPGCSKVQHIRHARVPIVKYTQQLLGLECDLSMGSM